MEEKKSGKGLAIASLVLGILAIINSFIPIINFIAYIFGIIALILGIIAIVKNAGRGMAIAGVVLAGVALILATIINAGTASLIEEGGSSSSSSSSSGSTNSSKVVEYTPVDIDTLEDALDNNAAAAKDTYNGKYFAVTGRLSVIDSDLKYISIVSTTDEWDIIGIHCTIKNEKTKEVVKTLSKDQIITVKGKITDVGEVLGYYLDIDEIVVQ